MPPHILHNNVQMIHYMILVVMDMMTQYLIKTVSTTNNFLNFVPAMLTIAFLMMNGYQILDKMMVKLLVWKTAIHFPVVVMMEWMTDHHLKIVSEYQRRNFMAIIPRPKINLEEMQRKILEQQGPYQATEKHQKSFKKAEWMKKTSTFKPHPILNPPKMTFKKLEPIQW